MATTLQLPFKRFVAQVSNGSVRAKASSLAMMQENENSLKQCDWHESAAKPADVSLPDNIPFKEEGYLNDRYDAYIQGGKANSATEQFEGYAGMVAYRFKLPAAYLSGAQTLTSFAVNIMRDRYLRAGVRAVAVLSASETPSTDWAVVRGEASTYKTESGELDTPQEGIRTYGFLNQADEDYLVDTRVASDKLELTLTGIDASKAQYLFVYLTLEDYQNRWLWHSQGVKREYWIEGSAMLVGSSNAVTFSADMQADAVQLLAGGDASGADEIKFPYPQLFVNSLTDSGFTTREEQYGRLGAFGDCAYQVFSLLTQDNAMKDRESFDALVEVSKNSGRAIDHGVAPKNIAMSLVVNNNSAVNSFDYKYGAARFLTPRFTSASSDVVKAQAGLSAWFHNREYYVTDTFADDMGKVWMPAFLQVACLCFRATAGGSVMTLGAVEAVPNTGIHLKFAVYKAPYVNFVGAFGYQSISQFLLADNVAQNDNVGSQIAVPVPAADAIKTYGAPLNVGGFNAQLLGVSEVVTGALAKNQTLTIKLAQAIEAGDMILILPIPCGITDNNSHNYYFGRKLDPKGTANAWNYNWMRNDYCKGWFPKITLA